MVMLGLWFEEFIVGAHYRHALSRTVTESDNVLFTSLTMNVQPLHLDEEFASASVYGRRIVNSGLTLSLVSAFQVPDLTFGTTLGNLGFESVRFPIPVLHGDTLRGESTVLATRASSSRPDAGIVRLRHIGLNQNDQVVCDMERVALMARAPER